MFAKVGDSITDMWNLAAAFPGKPYVNRGIGSQVTAQMLVRFEQDVVALQPSAVVILGGGCSGSFNFSFSRSNRWSGSGWV